MWYLEERFMKRHFKEPTRKRRGGGTPARGWPPSHEQRAKFRLALTEAMSTDEMRQRIVKRVMLELDGVFPVEITPTLLRITAGQWVTKRKEPVPVSGKVRKTLNTKERASLKEMKGWTKEQLKHFVATGERPAGSSSGSGTG